MVALAFAETKSDSSAHCAAPKNGRRDCCAKAGTAGTDHKTGRVKEGCIRTLGPQGARVRKPATEMCIGQLGLNLGNHGLSKGGKCWQVDAEKEIKGKGSKPDIAKRQ